MAWKARQGDNYSYGAKCDLTDGSIIAEAREILRTMEKKANKGIAINELNLNYAKNKATHPCREKAIGEFIMSYIDIPASVKIDDFRLIIFDIYDTNTHSGGYQGTLTSSDGVKYNGTPLINKKYLVSGSTQNYIVRPLRFSEFLYNGSESLSKYYTNGQIALTTWERVTSHEIIHFFGIGTHDIGYNYYAKQELLTNLRYQLLHGNLYYKLSYGDWFSVMGKSQYAMGLAPATSEYLGWITSNQIVKVNADATVTISEYNTLDANVTAQINLPNNEGRLYISYHAGTQYEESLKKPALASNTRGILVRYSSNRRLSHPLITSVLLDPDYNLKNHDFSIKEGESYSLFGITINDVDISDDKSSASFKVYFP
jgi:hypothetical protein